MNRDQMARIALRYDTTLSRAMLKALGVKPQIKKRGAVIVERYSEVRECFNQKHGVRM